MIIKEYVEIIASYYYIKRLENSNNIKKGDIITVRISDLSSRSHVIIDVRCDVCSKDKKISYSSYNKNISNGGYYSCSQSCASDKSKKTYFKKTGYTNQMLNPETVEKFKKTCMDRFGVDHPKKSDELKLKAIETCKKNFGVEYGFLLEKSKETMISKYGFDNPMKSPEILNNAQKTNTERYGNKTTLLNSDVAKKSKKTMIEKFGVEHALQNPDIMASMIKDSNRFKKHESTGILYQGKYEKDFLDFCYSIEEIPTRGLTFKYIHDGKNKLYYSDFYFENHNLIVEIKSTWYYNLHLSMNVCKEKAVIDKGYKYIFVIDMKYDDFINKIKKSQCD